MRELRRVGVLKPLLVGAIAGSPMRVRVAALRGGLLLRRRRRTEALLRAATRPLLAFARPAPGLSSAASILTA